MKVASSSRIAILMAAISCLTSLGMANNLQLGSGVQRSAERDALASYDALRKTFNTRLSGRYPFGELAAPDANLADVKAFFADYSARAEALRSALATSKDPRAADALSFLAQLDKVATFLSSNVLAGERGQPLTLVPAFRLMPSVSTGSEQVVRWSLRTDQQESLYPGRASASLEWNFGQAIALELVWASNSEWRPTMPNAAMAQGLTVAHERASFSAVGTWALLRLIETHRSNFSDPLDSRGVILEFRVPMTRRISNNRTGATEKDREALFYLGLRLDAMDPTSERLRTLVWPGGFIRSAP